MAYRHRDYRRTVMRAVQVCGICQREGAVHESTSGALLVLICQFMGTLPICYLFIFSANGCNRAVEGMTYLC